MGWLISGILPLVLLRFLCETGYFLFLKKTEALNQAETSPAEMPAAPEMKHEEQPQFAQYTKPQFFVHFQGVKLIVLAEVSIFFSNFHFANQELEPSSPVVVGHFSAILNSLERPSEIDHVRQIRPELTALTLHFKQVQAFVTRADEISLDADPNTTKNRHILFPCEFAFDYRLYNVSFHLFFLFLFLKYISIPKQTLVQTSREIFANAPFLETHISLKDTKLISQVATDFLLAFNPSSIERRLTVESTKPLYRTLRISSHPGTSLPQPPKTAVSTPQPLQRLESKNIPHTDVFTLIWDGLGLQIVNDLYGKHLPLLDVRASRTTIVFKAEEPKGVLMTSTTIDTEINFYNPEIVVWEPLLEPCRFELHFERHRRAEEDAEARAAVSGAKIPAGRPNALEDESKEVVEGKIEHLGFHTKLTILGKGILDPSEPPPNVKNVDMAYRKLAGVNLNISSAFLDLISTAFTDFQEESPREEERKSHVRFDVFSLFFIEILGGICTIHPRQ
jgi:hypothetical protein